MNSDCVFSLVCSWLRKATSVIARVLKEKFWHLGKMKSDLKAASRDCQVRFQHKPGHPVAKAEIFRIMGWWTMIKICKKNCLKCNKYDLVWLIWLTWLTWLTHTKKWINVSFLILSIPTYLKSPLSHLRHHQGNIIFMQQSLLILNNPVHGRSPSKDFFEGYSLISHTCAHKKNFQLAHTCTQEKGSKLSLSTQSRTSGWADAFLEQMNAPLTSERRQQPLNIETKANTSFQAKKNHFHFKILIMKIGMNFRRRKKHQKPWLRFFRKLLFFHNPDDPVRRRQPLCFWILTLAWRLPFNGLCWEKWAHCQVYLFGWIPLQKSPILLQRIEKLWEIWDDLKLEILKPRQTEFVIWSCKNMTLALVLPPLHLTNATKVNISQM